MANEDNASRVNLQSILEADVAMGIRRQADSSLFSLALIDRVFGKVYAETDPTEAFATRQLAYRESPINPVAPSLCLLMTTTARKRNDWSTWTTAAGKLKPSR